MSTAAGPANAPRPRPRASQGPFLSAVVAHRRIPRLPFLLLTLAVVAAGVLGLVSLNVSVNQQAFAIAKLERDNRAAQARYTSLQADVDRLKAPDRIARAAKTRGMVPAGRPQVATWPGSRAGATASPGAATSPAAPGARLAGGDDSAGWSLGDDPFPLKRYLAEP